MNTNTSTSRPPLTFFMLELALSIPFWVVGSVTELRFPFNSLWSFSPMIAALILVYRENKTAGMRSSVLGCSLLLQRKVALLRKVGYTYNPLRFTLTGESI